VPDGGFVLVAGEVFSVEFVVGLFFIVIVGVGASRLLFWSGFGAVSVLSLAVWVSAVSVIPVSSISVPVSVVFSAPDSFATSIILSRSVFSKKVPSMEPNHLNPCFSLDIIDQPFRLVAIDGHTESFLAPPGSPSRTMYIRFHPYRWFCLDDYVDLGEIQPSCCYVGGDYAFELS
jgi:hypothetical protein